LRYCKNTFFKNTIQYKSHSLRFWRAWVRAFHRRQARIGAANTHHNSRCVAFAQICLQTGGGGGGGGVCVPVTAAARRRHFEHPAHCLAHRRALFGRGERGVERGDRSLMLRNATQLMRVWLRVYQVAYSGAGFGLMTRMRRTDVSA
jgi:hypothetical protein